MIEASDALAEHSGLIFNTHMAAQNYHSSSRKGTRYCFLASSSVLGTHVICIHTCRQTLIYIKNSLQLAILLDIKRFAFLVAYDWKNIV